MLPGLEDRGTVELGTLNVADDQTPLFTSTFHESIFLAAVLCGQAFNLTPFGATIYSSNLIAERLSAEGDQGQLTWILSAYSLTTGSFVLVGGSLGDTVGPRPVWIFSLVWVMVFNLISGFARHPAFYDVCRALAGIGAGIMLPVSVALLGATYPPGKKRNLIFGIFAGGSVFEVLLAHFVNASWIWWFHACKNALILVIGYLAIPRKYAFDAPQKSLGSFDMIGSFLGVSGLTLFCFAFIQSLLDGWKAATVLAPLVIGASLLIGFTFWEARIAAKPIMPFDVWRAPTFGYVVIVALLDFMSFGIFIAYYTQFIKNFRGANELGAVASVSPFTVDACLAAFLSAFLVSRLSAQAILTIGLAAMLIANVLLVTAHPDATYWTSTFFAPAIAAFGPDLTFTAAQIIASNTVSLTAQGVAGSMVGTVLNYGLAWGVALGSIVEQHTNKGGTDELRGLRGAGYLGVGMAGLGLTITWVFVRLPKDAK